MEILHTRGKENVITAALSQKEEGVKSYAISVVAPDSLNEIRGEYAKDLDTCALIHYPNLGPKFKWRNYTL